MTDLDLRAALADALEGLEEMSGYVPEWFRVKWHHQDYIDRAKAALAVAGDIGRRRGPQTGVKA